MAYCYISDMLKMSFILSLISEKVQINVTCFPRPVNLLVSVCSRNQLQKSYQLILFVNATLCDPGVKTRPAHIKQFTATKLPSSMPQSLNLTDFNFEGHACMYRHSSSPEVAIIWNLLCFERMYHVISIVIVTVPRCWDSVSRHCSCWAALREFWKVTFFSVCYIAARLSNCGWCSEIAAIILQDLISWSRPRPTPRDTRFSRTHFPTTAFEFILLCNWQ